mgnify:CR=1 FL=1
MFDIVVPKVEVLAKTENHGTFQLEPLEPGFGTTLGNALRRVLLSSLPGAAVNSVRIDGVYHEFSDIAGVREDVTEIVLNVKQLRLRSAVDHPEPLRLEVKGVGRVTAADIQCPPEVEIVNPELYLLSVDDPDTTLSMEFTVQKGKGYLPADHREGLPIGVVPVDAIFTPIRKVNYTVEETRIGVTTYERLLLDVWTDGTIEPEEAVAQSANILIRQFGILAELGGKPEPQLEKEQMAATAIPARLYDVPIEDLDLSVRAYNCLKRAGITKVGQVLEMTEEDLLGVRNFGRKSLDELKERLEARGFIEGSRLAASSAAAAQVEAAPAEAAVEEPAAVAEEEEEEKEEAFAALPPEEEEEELLAAEEEEEEEGAPPEYEAYEQWSEEDWEEEEEEERGYKKRRRAGRKSR